MRLFKAALPLGRGACKRPPFMTEEIGLEKLSLESRPY